MPMGNDAHCSSMMTFHEYHGGNIVLKDNNTVAYRWSGFADGITFSKEPLVPGEIFLMEIEEVEHGWSGNLRCGLTQDNPSTHFDLPQYALPYLTAYNGSWIIPITKVELDHFERTDIGQLYPSIYERNNFLHTPKGRFPTSVLLPSHKFRNNQETVYDDYTVSFPSQPSFYDIDYGSLDYPAVDRDYLHPADVRSRIGVTYIPRGDTAELYIFLNGKVFGPCANDIPYKRAPLFVVIELYGTTKRVRIIQNFGIPSLKIACRDKILQQVSHSKISKLPLPRRLLQFLTFQ